MSLRRLIGTGAVLALAHFNAPGSVRFCAFTGSDQSVALDHQADRRASHDNVPTGNDESGPVKRLPKCCKAVAAPHYTHTTVIGIAALVTLNDEMLPIDGSSIPHSRVSSPDPPPPKG